jgi:2-keto-4-pentenoate hydratase/2-oxohepta-3-ene-1,7-dioic acid hydratase in catechol pathway
MTKLVRFQQGETTAYGLLNGDRVQPIAGDLFGSQQPTGPALPVSEVKLLFPVKPPKIFAVGLNYRSHLGSRTAPVQPEIFYKPVSALQNPGDPIVTPPQSRNMHYEGELVAVVGKQCRRISVDEARTAVFGVTCGNDVSERDWQNGAAKDLQWWRAKGADTFAPLGPCVVTGIDYSKLLLTTRVNGNVVQQQYTSDLLFDVPAIVSFISQWTTLEPGDLIYTGTPGSTSKLNPGDVVEIEIESIGVLRNPVE